MLCPQGMSGWTVDIIEVGLIPRLPLNIYLPDAPEESVLDVPCFCYLLSQADKHVLIDTGPDLRAAAGAGFVVEGDARTALQSMLSRRRLGVDAIDAIIHTHLHYDHMQNDHLFPGARVLVQAREVEWSMSDKADRFYIQTRVWQERVKDRLSLISGESELFPGIMVLPNGGHTPGHQSVLVETAEGTICLCGDIVPMTANTNIVPVCMDAAATREFQDRARRSDWELVPGHDPVLRDHRYYVPDTLRAEPPQGQ